MAYLIVKILFLLLLSALGGALLMYWWVRRRYQDVTQDFTQAQSDNLALESEISRLKQSFQSLEDVPAQLVAIAQRVEEFPASVDRGEGANLLLNLPNLPKNDSEEASLSALERTDHIPAAGNVERSMEPFIADLTPVLEAIENWKLPEAKQVDFRPVLEAIEKKEIPQPASTDLSPLFERINQLEQKLDLSMGKQDSIEPPPKPTVNLLASPTHGEPDELQRISGIGPALEKMLHDIGVYYFWQIAEWSDKDIDDVDDMLDAFKGRIKRDSWVKQANALAEKDPA